MPCQNAVAFKEWASVVLALASGRQMVILRKGGLHEVNGEFKAGHFTFFLFPTFEHQKSEDLTPEGRVFFDRSQKTRDLSEITLQHSAVVENILWVDDFDKLAKVEKFHIWSEKAVRKKFEWGDCPGLYVMVARIFSLRLPLHLPNRPEYSGCRSWVELEIPEAANEAVPVLKDNEFSKGQTRLLNLLA